MNVQTSRVFNAHIFSTPGLQALAWIAIDTSCGTNAQSTHPSLALLHYWLAYILCIIFANAMGCHLEQPQPPHPSWPPAKQFCMAQQKKERQGTKNYWPMNAQTSRVWDITGEWHSHLSATQQGQGATSVPWLSDHEHMAIHVCLMMCGCWWLPHLLDVVPCTCQLFHMWHMHCCQYKLLLYHNILN